MVVEDAEARECCTEPAHVGVVEWDAVEGRWDVGEDGVGDGDG